MKATIDFFVPGFSKCGTTTLFFVLNHHPQIFIPDFKEPRHFGTMPSPQKTAWFEGLYAGAEKGQLKGDCSTFYSSIYLEADASRDIFKHNPRAKLIFIARDPIDRIESSFREMHNSAPKFGLNTPYLLEEALVEMPQILDDTSFFARINVYRKLFGVEQMLVIFMEDLKTDTETVAGRCYDFLGLSTHRFTRDMLPHMNKGEEKLYDTRLFRWMRCHRILGRLLCKINIDRQDRIATRVRLRKPFREPIYWSAKAKSMVKERLAPDIDAFLRDFNKLENRWPRYRAFHDQV